MTPEQQARQQIDAQLVACGWAIQDYAQFNPAAAHGIALREVPLKSGQCDYLLLVDRKPVGVIEAKEEGTLLSGVAEQTILSRAFHPASIINNRSATKETQEYTL
jgi:type I restriction enzyme R subunit